LEFLLESSADVTCHCKDQLLTTITYAIYVCTSSDNITATFLIQKMVFAYRLNNWKHGTRFRILSPDQHSGISDDKVIEIMRSNKQILLREDKDLGEWVFAHKVSVE